MTEILNLQTLCRCCHSDGCYKSLQLSYVHDNRIEVYSNMLKDTLSVAISPPPIEASYAICDFCIKKLRDAAYFKQQVVECEQKFEEYCKNELSLTVKAEIDYENSQDSIKSEICDNEGGKYEKCKDEKYDDQIMETKNDGVDDLYKTVDLEIKEENADSPNHIQNKITIECVQQVKDRQQITEKCLKRQDSKARVERTKRRKYTVDTDFELHVKTEDGDIFICKICDNKYKLLKLLRTHILIQHKDAYRCRVCSLQCVDRFQYMMHKKTHANNKFKCNFCGKSFTKKTILNQHLNAHTRTEKFQCDICRKMYAKKQTLKKHILDHYGGNKKYMCDVCGLLFYDTANMTKHIRVVHEKQRPFKCHLCPKTFTAKKHLKDHSHFHTGERPFKCDVCGDGFVSSWRLRYHKFKHHLKSSGAPGKNLYTYKVHNCHILQRDSRGKFLSKHIGRKDYKCHLCSKDFTCQFTLNRHVAGHSGVKAFACDLCDKKYTEPYMLSRHKKAIHDPSSLSYPGRVVELVKCDLCNRSFKNIQKHMLSHKTRPHVCDICFKSYPERNTLNRHIMIVHQGVRRFPCTLCDKRYTRLVGLQHHAKKVHKLELKKKVVES